GCARAVGPGGSGRHVSDRPVQRIRPWARMAMCAYVDALGQQHGIRTPLRALARANGGPDVELNPGARLRRQGDAPCLLAIKRRLPGWEVIGCTCIDLAQDGDPELGDEAIRAEGTAE